MNQIRPSLLALLLVIVMSLKAYSTHMAGADLTYRYIGNHQYEITYTFYRDCIGVDAQTSINLNYGSTTCNIQSSATLLPIPGTGQLISFVCPGALTTCDGGTDPGIQEWEYRGIVTIDQQCPDWSFGVQECCRNGAITTIANAISEDMYIEANLNNTVSENNSPVFSNVPIAFECIGQNNFYNHGGYDADGDSLEYAFYFPLSAPHTPVIYNSGYSIASPITSIPPVQINHFTGDIFMHPVAVEIGVLAVRITEYRNGVVIGAVVRDIQVYTINCNNNLPTASGINGTPSYSYSTCVSGPICFDIFTDDLDIGDTLSVLWNHTISTATFTVDTTLAFPTTHFCWTPTPADIRPQPYVFVVTVHDDACPSNGVQSYAYSIYLNSLAVSATSTPATCNDNSGSITTSTTGASGNLTYVWQPNVSNGSSASNLTAGVYYVTVTDTSGCMGNVMEIVNNSSGITASIVSSDNATCQSGEDGSAEVVAMGGQPPYTYLWTPGGDTTSTAENLGPGLYTVRVQDYNDCPAFATVVIGYDFAAPPLNLGIDTALCIGSTFTLDAGIGFTYLWSGGQTTQTISVTTAGTYNVLITDGNGCENFDVITLDFITCYRGGRLTRIDQPQLAIVAYPNPFGDLFNVSISGADGVMSLSIYDAYLNLISRQDIVPGNSKSKSLERGSHIQKEVSLENLPPGIYILQISSGQESKSVRVVKM